MAKSKLIKLSGWAFVASAFSFISILTGSDPIAIPGSVVSAILLAVGMSSLRTGYGERIGSLGRNMLLLGMFGPVLWFIVMASMALTVTETQVNEGLWVLIFVGPAISLLGLSLFGLTALRSRPMPRLNWLPVLAGIWYPVTYVLYSVYDISNKGVFPDQYLPALVLMVVIQFLALCILGFVLMDDSSKELATA
ncbi:MAG TPA: hypothetical protein VFR47_01870 [Anaerolineales bacterium]|nr:hypothetical protein [Anaerolineales bacterium]